MGPTAGNAAAGSKLQASAGDPRQYSVSTTAPHDAALSDSIIVQACSTIVPSGAPAPRPRYIFARAADELSSSFFRLGVVAAARLQR